jgi:hypothetical protein
MNHTVANKNVHCILTRDEGAEKLRPEFRSSLVKGGGEVTEERMEKILRNFRDCLPPIEREG